MLDEDLHEIHLGDDSNNDSEPNQNDNSKIGKKNIDVQGGETSTQNLFVEIADAMSEKKRILFSIHTKTNLTDYRASDLSVSRAHEEFRWLHDQLEGNVNYRKYIIPPPPPRPNFDSSREKLVTLTQSEGSLTKQEYDKLKAELEGEYLAIFKKTVALHEAFLKRLAEHKIFCESYDLRVFLEYDGELNIRNKNKKEIVSNFFTRSVSGAISTAQNHFSHVDDMDEDTELKKLRHNLQEYHKNLLSTTYKSQYMVQAQKCMSQDFIRVLCSFESDNTLGDGIYLNIFNVMHTFYEKYKKLSLRSTSDIDLKLVDTLRYNTDCCEAALALLSRRLTALANYSTANKSLEKARRTSTRGGSGSGSSNSKDNDLIVLAEAHQEESYEIFQSISVSTEDEIKRFMINKTQHLSNSLYHLALLELKNNENQLQLMKNTLRAIADGIKE